MIVKIKKLFLLISVIDAATVGLFIMLSPMFSATKNFCNNYNGLYCNFYFASVVTFFCLLTFIANTYLTPKRLVLLKLVLLFFIFLIIYLFSATPLAL